MNYLDLRQSGLKKLIMVFILLSWFGSPEGLKAELKYNLSYSLKGATRGRILLIIPFRVFYESFASMDFKAVKSPDGDYEFFFADIPETGYMMRTSGFPGKTLVILSADHDLKKALSLATNKLEIFNLPYYSKFIKRKKPFLFKIFSDDKNSAQFKRHQNGVHFDFFINLTVRYKYYPEILNIDFNIYKILMEMAKAYNHSFLPGESVDELIKNPDIQWQSPALDYSDNINIIVRLAARIMKKLKQFRQERSLKLHYRITTLNEDIIEIQGYTNPGVLIWGKYGINQFARKVKLRRCDGVLVEDTINYKIENSKSRGLEATISLTLRD